jgi:hypothetical protein
MNMLTVAPAYGRDYRTQKQVLEAYRANRDFQIQDIRHPNYGGYVNRDDLIRGKYDRLDIRYNRLASVMSIKPQ